ncbi:MAG: alpha/beta fold hydrolase [Burkholderiaceae bacterium]
MRATGPSNSALARLQQGLVLVALVLAAGWVGWAWDRGPAWLGAGLAVVFFGHAAVLALEFVLVALVHGHDPAPRAAPLALLKAWWQETHVAPRVFAWRQPFAWRRWPDTVGQDTDPALPCVVLVHGFVCNRGFWLPWMPVLRGRRQAYASVNLEPVFGSIDDYIPLIESAVQDAERAGGPLPVLVCHSMGGLAARAWLASASGNPARVGRIITIGSPHHGTWLGHFSHVPNGRQMRPGNAWLQALQQRERAQRPEGTYAAFVCWYSSADNIVFPASTASLPGADNRFLPATPHVGMAFKSVVMDGTLALCRPEKAGLRP